RDCVGACRGRGAGTGSAAPRAAADARACRIGSSHQEHALADRLRVEDAISLGCLGKFPAVSEEAIDRNPALLAKPCAVGLAGGREGPGADDGELLPQQVATHVQGDAVALAYEANRGPGSGAPDRDQTARGRA